MGSRISIPRDVSRYTSPSSSRTSVTRVKTSSAQRELSTRSAFTSLLIKPKITFGLLGRILRDNDREHRVGYGESLAFLAEKYGTTVKALKNLTT